MGHLGILSSTFLEKILSSIQVRFIQLGNPQKTALLSQILVWEEMCINRALSKSKEFWRMYAILSIEPCSALAKCGGWWGCSLRPPDLSISPRLLYCSIGYWCRTCLTHNNQRNSDSYLAEVRYAARTCSFNLYVSFQVRYVTTSFIFMLLYQPFELK